MSVFIRSATAADTAAIAENYFQAHQHLGWFQHVNVDADPNDLKAFFQSIVQAIQKVKGVTLVAEKGGQLVGHLLGWERASDSAVETALPNPYYDPNVTVGIRGRVCSRWVNQQADIRRFCGQMGSGRFFYVDSVAVLPQYQRQGIGRLLFQKAIEEARSSGLAVGLVAPPESAPFFEKLGLQRAAELITSRDDGRFQLIPMSLRA
ncbi:hypothetical protein NliqN6_6490 [Naganishia liquefaciens]|uniref:N-acetyltransferase domain-containing protein n=1 Tax=Naganishia liquefaciens TaxID=104408 RepID=A0A8H3TZR9_9TREE|nr:hypothetical protein NliqN6_6490 [Naganishia liquefaciens]